jgi:hypothetical protein
MFIWRVSSCYILFCYVISSSVMLCPLLSCYVMSTNVLLELLCNSSRGASFFDYKHS